MLIYYEILLENKKTYILHHLMYKVHNKGLENIGLLFTARMLGP